MSRRLNVEVAPRGAWSRFWFNPADPFALNAIRVATGALLIAWLITLTAGAESFFGLNGWFDRQAFVEAARQPAEAPKPLSWSLLYVCGESRAAFQAAFWGSLGVLALFTLGLFPRVTAVLAWLIVVSFTANPAFDDDVEALFRLLTLYLAVGYLLQGPWRGVSWAQRLLGPWRTFLFARGEVPPSVGVNVALRLIQVHLAILLVVSGLHKLQSGYWWAGVAHWYLLYSPMETTPDHFQRLASAGRFYLALLNVAAYATLAWQITFPAFAWRAGFWRVLLLGGALIGWVGLATIYRAPFFGAALTVGAFAYLGAPEWQRVRTWLRSIVAHAPARAGVAAAPEPAAVGGGR
jgi:hypothetical protein